MRKNLGSLRPMALTILVTLGLTIGLAPSALAAGGPLTPGVPVVAVLASGEVNDYTFAGTAGEHVTVDVSASTWTSGTSAGSAVLELLDQGGVQRDGINIGQTPNFVDLTLGSTGTWTVRLDPSGASSGTATFTLAKDAPPAALTAGIAVPTTIGFRGQNAGYTFAGTAGQHVTVDVSASTWTDGPSAGSAVLRVLDQGGVERDGINIGQTPNFVDLTLGSTGTWAIVLDPSGASTGTATFTVANDIPSVALSSGASVATTIGLRGQNAGYTFAGSAGQHVSFIVSASTWTDGPSAGSAVLRVLDQGGVERDGINIGQTPNFVDLTLGSTGTWSVRLDPSGASTGAATFTYVNGATSTPTTVTARAVPTTVTWGARVALSGALKLANGAPMVGASVAVQSQAGKTWTTLATVSTQAAGAWATTVRPSTNRIYRAVFAGSPGTRASTSKSVVVGVRPHISLNLSKSKVRLGKTVTFSGTVAPSHKGRLVSLQLFHHGNWVTKKSAKLSKRSKYSVAWKVTSRTDYTWRVVLRRHSDHAAGVSRRLKLTVK
jgi:hypothetical protein